MAITSLIQTKLDNILCFINDFIQLYLSDPSLNSASCTYPCGMVVIIFFILVSKKRFFRGKIFALGSGCTSWNHVLVDDSPELSHQSHASFFYAPELHNQA